MRRIAAEPVNGVAPGFRGFAALYSKAVSDPRWDRLWDLFHEARDREPAERDAFLDRSCGDDEPLRRELAELLAAEAGRPSLLDRPPAWVGDLDADPLLGRRIGPYRIDSVLGEGGMGVVYAAEQERPLRRPVALKVVKLGMDTLEVVGRFEAERRLLALLDHPHVARVYDAGSTEEGRPYFVMERVAGQPITAYADARRLTVDDRLATFLDVCSAVHHAHQRGVLHRDLKPSNVLVAEHDGRPFPVVIDFGIAKALHETPGAATPRTEVGRRIGTPEYMSPEQLAGAEAPVDIRSDLYSLGVLLYTLLTGGLPFERRVVGGVLVGDAPSTGPLAPSTRFGRMVGADAVAAARRTEPRSLRRRLHGDLDWILLKCLATDPDARYGAVSDLAADLRRHLAGRPVEAGPPSALYRARKFLHRHALATAAAALLLVGLLVGVAGLAWGLLEARRARAEAELRREEAQRVAGFLLELFGGADPYRSAEGAEITLRQVLDRGADRVLTELEGQPSVQAALLDRIGTVYLHLDARERAAPLLERALALRRPGPGSPERVELAESLEALARLRSRSGDHASAAALARQALEVRRRLYGEAGPETVPALLALGEVLRQHSEHAAAAAALDEAAALERGGLVARRDDDERLADILRELALLHARTGDHAAAEAALREVLALARLRPNPLLRATTLERLGVLLTNNGREREAEPVLREVVELRRRHLPADHPEIAAALGRLGLALHYLRQWDEAESLYQEARAIERRRPPGEDRETVVRLNNLGLLAFDRGRFDDSEELFRQALAAQRAIGGDEHPDLAFPMTNLGRALQLRGELAAAEPLFRRAVEIRRRAAPSAHPQLALTLLGLGEILTARGELAAADAALAEALDLRRRHWPAGDWRTAETESALGACRAAQGRDADAETLLRSGALGLERTRGAEDWRTRLAARRLAAFEGARSRAG